MSDSNPFGRGHQTGDSPTEAQQIADMRYQISERQTRIDLAELQRAEDPSLWDLYITRLETEIEHITAAMQDLVALASVADEPSPRCSLLSGEPSSDFPEPCTSPIRPCCACADGNCACGDSKSEDKHNKDKGDSNLFLRF